MEQSNPLHIVKETSVGFYTKAHPDPKPQKVYGCYDDEIDWVQNIHAQRFIIPSSSDTGPLATEWRDGGLKYPRRTDFGMSKADWHTKVVRPLEQRLPHVKCFKRYDFKSVRGNEYIEVPFYKPNDNFTGNIIFHFNNGVIADVEEI